MNEVSKKSFQPLTKTLNSFLGYFKSSRSVSLSKTEHFKLFEFLFSMLLGLVILMSGCAPKYSVVMQSYSEAPICCNSMKEFQYESIIIEESKQVLIDENSPAFLFNSEKSYFKAFELPIFTQPYYVNITSYSMATPEGPDSDYVFYPILLTLDKNFNIIRTSKPEIFLPLKNDMFDKFAWMAAGFKLQGVFPFASENKEEKYLVIKTSEELLGGTTFFPTPIYYEGDGFGRTAKNSPSGAIVISLIAPADLFKKHRQKWANSLESVKLEKQYTGNGFKVLPPQSPDYRFFEESISYNGSKQKILFFGRIHGGEIVSASVETKMMGNEYLSLAEALSRVREEEKMLREKMLSEAIVDINYEQSTTTVDGVDCSRIDYFGKGKEVFFLPVRGYSISCIHPDWSQKIPTLFIHIFVNYTYPLDKNTTSFPPELLDFYKNVRFIKAEQ